MNNGAINEERFFIPVPEAERVSAVWTWPARPTIVMALAHGAGANMDHSFMQALAQELAAHDLAVLRFNFLYMEKKQKRPDPPAMAHRVLRLAWQVAHDRFPSLPLIAAGKSFGGRMASQSLAREPDNRVKALVFFGFPLHPANKPGTERAAHLKAVAVPLLFLQGTRDALADLSLLAPIVSALPNGSLATFEGVDHSFQRGKTNAVPALAKTASEWLFSLKFD